jgi:Fe2+ transport system protein FeoA
LAIAPLGDPVEILCGANRLSLRRQEAAQVHVDLSVSPGA